MKFFLVSLLMLSLIPGIKASYPNNKQIHSFGKSDSRKVYLTFDDGYSYKNTNEIVNILIEEKVPAAFFLTGDFINDAASLVRKMKENGFIIGNHTWSHKSIKTMKIDKLKDEVDCFEKRYMEITGEYPLKVFRPPMGEYSDKTISYLTQRGYHIFFWSNTYADYSKKDMGSEYAKKMILSNLRGGDIILLHTMSKSNINALRDIIHEVQNRGFTFSELSDFL